MTTDLTTATNWLAEQAVHNVEVVVVDIDGVIVATNDSWEAFCLFNGGDPVRTGVGVSYLDACRRAGHDEYAAAVAQMIQATLDGAPTTTTSLVIPCHSGSHQRWFELFISPRADDDDEPIGATIVLIPVSHPRSQPPTSSSANTRERQIEALHHSVIGQLHAAALRLHQLARQADPAERDEHLTAALHELDTAVADLRHDALINNTASAPTQTTGPA